MKLEEKLIRLRKQSNLSQSEVAEALGVSRQSISRWECGTARPTTENLIALSQLYGADVVTLTGAGGRPEGEPAAEPMESPGAACPPCRKAPRTKHRAGRTRRRNGAEFTRPRLRRACARPSWQPVCWQRRFLSRRRRM